TSTEVDLVKILISAFLNITSQDNLRQAFLDQRGAQIMFDYWEKNWTNIDTENLTNTKSKEILSILQVLLTVVVSERDIFIVRNEDELWKIVKTGCQIAEILGINRINQTLNL
ncbi:18460_t:CDS:1, partial [Dentiscutata erythropus]